MGHRGQGKGKRAKLKGKIATEGAGNAEKRPILAVIVFRRSDLDEYACIDALVTV